MQPRDEPAGSNRRDRAGPVAGVVLAAGLSSRMGKNKLLLEIGGTSVLRRALLAAAAAGLDPIIVVLGHQRELVQPSLAGIACTPVVNEDYASGIDTSLRAGFRALGDGVQAAVAMLADMPFVTAEMLQALVERWRRSEAPLAVSTYEGVLAPPMLYGRQLFAELRELEGEGCGKRVVKRHRAEAIELAWPGAALADLDVPADVERVRAVLDGR